MKQSFWSFSLGLCLFLSISILFSACTKSSKEAKIEKCIPLPPNSVLKVTVGNASNSFNVWNVGKYAHASGQNSVGNFELNALLKCFNTQGMKLNRETIFSVVTYVNKPLVDNEIIVQENIIGFLVYSETKDGQMYIQVLKNNEKGQFSLVEKLTGTANVQTSNDISDIGHLLGDNQPFITAIEQSTTEKCYERKSKNSLSFNLFPF